MSLTLGGGRPSGRRVLGDDHPQTLTSINNMGALLRSMGKLAEAELYVCEALDGFGGKTTESRPQVQRPWATRATLASRNRYYVPRYPDHPRLRRITTPSPVTVNR